MRIVIRRRADVAEHKIESGLVQTDDGIHRIAEWTSPNRNVGGLWPR